MDDALRRTLHRLYATETIDHLPGLFFVIARDGRFLRWNRALELLTGLDAQQLAHATAGDFLSMDQDELELRLAQAFTGGAQSGEALLHVRGGEPAHYLLSVHRSDADGTPVLVGTGIDMRPVKEANRRAEESRMMMAAAFDASPDAIVSVSRDARIEVHNRRYSELFEIPPALLERRDPSELRTLIASRMKDPDAYLARSTAILSGPVERTEDRFELADGRVIECVIEPYRIDGAWDGRLYYMRDISETLAARRRLTSKNERLESRVDEQLRELRAATERLAFLAFHDSLTGLPNRLQLYQVLAARLERLRGLEGTPASSDGGETPLRSVPATPFAVAFVDLDGFKLVNDRHGHEAGDTVLRTIAERMRRVTAAGDLVGRLAGDEFVLVVQDPDRAADVVQMLLDAVHAPIAVADTAVRVSASVGVRIARPDHAGPEALLAEADAAMYESKRRRA